MLRRPRFTREKWVQAILVKSKPERATIVDGWNRWRVLAGCEGNLDETFAIPGCDLTRWDDVVMITIPPPQTMPMPALTQSNCPQLGTPAFLDYLDGLRAHGDNHLVAVLVNLGAGKTTSLINVVAYYGEERVLFLVPDFACARDVVARFPSRGLHRPFIFRGKGGGKNTPAPCEQPKGRRYAPGCAECNIHPGKGHPGCEYWEQYEAVADARVVVATTHSAFLATEFNWDIIIVDESPEGLLYSTFLATEQDLLAAGVRVAGDWPRPLHRLCEGDCPLRPTCRKYDPDNPCEFQSSVIRPTFSQVAEPGDDESYFVQQSLLKGETLACWDFYYDKPRVLAVHPFPEPHASLMLFASATATEAMVREWFYNNFDHASWRVDYLHATSHYENEIFTYHLAGSFNSEDTILKSGVVRRICEQHPHQRVLVVCDNKHEKQFRVHLSGNIDLRVAHFPLVGVNTYRDFDAIVVTWRFKFDMATRMLLACRFGVAAVADMEMGILKQAIGRIRPGFVTNGDRHGNAHKPVYLLFEFDDWQFPRVRAPKEFGIAWVRAALQNHPGISASRLMEVARRERPNGVPLDRGKFLALFRKVKATHNDIPKII